MNDHPIDKGITTELCLYAGDTWRRIFLVNMSVFGVLVGILLGGEALSADSPPTPAAYDQSYDRGFDALWSNTIPVQSVDPAFQDLDGDGVPDSVYPRGGTSSDGFGDLDGDGVPDSVYPRGGTSSDGFGDLDGDGVPDSVYPRGGTSSDGFGDLDGDGVPDDLFPSIF
jgi:hypothetical protein